MLNVRCHRKAARMLALDEVQNPEVKTLAEEAVSFVLRHSWCAEVVSCRVGFAIPGKLGVFLLELTPVGTEVDRHLWVVVGDVPPAYLVCDDAPDWHQALARYTGEMSRWVAAVREGGSLDDVIPVTASATRENAELLQRRIDFIEREILSRPAEEFECDI